MAKATFPFIFFLALLSQSTDPALIRVGTATQLTEQDIGTIESLLPEKPWLLNGPPTQFAFRQYLEAYLPPMTTTAGIHRGTYIEVVRPLELRTRQPKGEWTTDRHYEYAQVAIPGRPFDDIQDDHDLNRPFRVLGKFEDEEIIGIVNSIRSQAGKVRYGFETIQPWPILGVDYDPNGSIRVMTWEKFVQGQSMLLRREGNDWVITSVGVWAA